MNKDNAKDYLPLVQALAEGEVIQFNSNTWHESHWIDVERLLDSNPAQSYRIKPEPREIWVNRYPDGRETSAFSSRQDAVADAAIDGDGTAKQICYREVIE